MDYRLVSIEEVLHQLRNGYELRHAVLSRTVLSQFLILFDKQDANTSKYTVYILGENDLWVIICILNVLNLQTSES